MVDSNVLDYFKFWEQFSTGECIGIKEMFFGKHTTLLAVSDYGHSEG